MNENKKECTKKAVEAYTNMLNEYTKSTKALICPSGISGISEREAAKFFLEKVPTVPSPYQSILIPFLGKF